MPNIIWGVMNKMFHIREQSIKDKIWMRKERKMMIILLQSYIPQVDIFVYNISLRET